MVGDNTGDTSRHGIGEVGAGRFELRRIDGLDRADDRVFLLLRESHDDHFVECILIFLHDHIDFRSFAHIFSYGGKTDIRESDGVAWFSIKGISAINGSCCAIGFLTPYNHCDTRQRSTLIVDDKSLDDMLGTYGQNTREQQPANREEQFHRIHSHLSDI